MTELQKIGDGYRVVKIAGRELILSALTGNDLVAFESEIGSWVESLSDPDRFFTVRRWLIWRMLRRKQEITLEEVGDLFGVEDFKPGGLVEELINSMMPSPKEDGGEASPSPQPGEPTS